MLTFLGLHASISIHICDEWFNQTTGEWGPNLDCFISRVGMHPERLENIYFDYVVLLRAMTKISDYLAGYEFCTGDNAVDQNIMTVIHELVDLVKQSPPAFDEKLLFRDSSSNQLKNQFRDHFRNVTRIMDCVGCEKCRLWGKVQTMGLGTALKVLFSYDEASLKYVFVFDFKMTPLSDHSNANDGIFDVCFNLGGGKPTMC